MRYRITLILLAISAVLSIWIYTLEKGDARNEDHSVNSGGLFGPDILLADRLEVRGPALEESGERILIKKGNDQWQIQKPMNWPANFYIVNQILNQIQFLPKEYSFTVDSVLEVGKTLADYGLQTPRLELTLGWRERKSTVAFGLPSEMGGKTYLLGPDRRNIYAVSQQLENSLLQGLEFWQSPEIFTLPVIEVASMSLDINDDGNLTKTRLEKTGVEWKLEAPIKAPADAYLVNERINALQGIKALGFLNGKSKQEAQEALLKPIIRITLQGTTQGQTLELAEPIEEGNPVLYARFDAHPTTYFMVSAAPFANLRKAQTFFRQKQFLDFSSAQVSTIRIEDEAHQVNLQKLERGDWQVQEPGATRWIQAEGPVILMLLDILARLKALNFPHDAPSQEDLQRLGLENPVRTITLQTGKPPKPLTILFGQPENGETLYAKLAEVPYIYEVEPTVKGILRTNHLHFRDRRLFPDNQLPAEATLKHLAITRLPGGEKVLELPSQKAPPEKDEPPTEPDPLAKDLQRAHDGLLISLAEHLGRLRVREYAAQGFDKESFHGPAGDVPWSYRLEVTYKLPEGNEPAQRTLVLHLTARLSGRQQGAGHEDSGNAFLLHQQTIDLLHRILPGATPPAEYRKPPEPTPPARQSPATPN